MTAVITADLIARCRRIPTPTWSDALDTLDLSGLRMHLPRRAGSLPIVGPVVTVEEEVGERGSAAPADFGIGLILPACAPGDIVLVHQEGGPAASALGGLAAMAALRRGVAGFVIDGACRDVEELRQIGLPVLSREVTPASGRGRVRIRAVNESMRVGSVEVTPGDLLVADHSGLVTVPASRIEDVLAAAEARARDDAEQARALGDPSQT